MYKYIFTTIFLLGFFILPSIVFSANDVNFTTDTTISLSIGDFTVASGSVCDEVVVDSSTIQFTLSADSAVILRSNNRYLLNNDSGIDTNCGDPTYSQLSLSGRNPTATVIVTPSTTTCEDQSSAASTGVDGSSSGSSETTPSDSSEKSAGEELAEKEPQPQTPTTPQAHNLTEGDLIRAENDFDIFIINQYGYKRLFLNPTIFEMYGHLGSWNDVKTVTPETRDAFITSNHYRYVNEDKVYHLNITGEDTGTLHWLNITSTQFLDQGGIPNAIFTINKDEYDWYSKGEEMRGL